MSTKNNIAKQNRNKINLAIISTIILIAILLMGILLMIPLLILISYVSMIILIITQIVYHKIKKIKITEDNKKSLIIYILCIIIAPVLLLTTSIASNPHSARRSLPLNIFDTIVTIKPPIKTIQIGDAKVSIYSLNNNFSISSLLRDKPEPGYKLINIEFHAESAKGDYINRSCYFDIVDKVNQKIDQDYTKNNQDNYSYSAILPAVSISNKEQRCSMDDSNGYIVRISNVVDSNSTKIKLKYYGDKVYYIDLN